MVEIIPSLKAMPEAIEPTHPSYAIIHDPRGLINAKSRLPESNMRNSKAKARDQSHVDRHNIGFVERLRAIGTFSHAISKTVVNTMIAESVSTCLDCCVLEVLATDSA